MSEHPTEFELTAYARRTLGAGELLRVDDHLAVCAACRRKTVESADAPRRLASTMAAMRREQAPVLTFREAATSHIRRRGPLYAAAAVVMIIASATWGSRSRPDSVPAGPVARQTAATVEADTLSRDERAVVNLAVASGQMPASRALGALAPAAGTLMGGGSSRTSSALLAALGPSHPVGVVVDSDRPTLEWGASDPNAKYRVAVFDDAFQQVAVSPWQAESRWTASEPLARGRVYTWQVTARVGGRDTTAPAPPQPEAKFEVTSLEDSERIAAIRKRAGESHLALAVLLAQEGLLDEAEHELAMAPPSTAVTQLRQSLARMRRP